MKTYTIGTSWKRLLAVSAILSAVLTGYTGAPLAATSLTPKKTTAQIPVTASPEKPDTCLIANGCYIAKPQ